MSTKKTNLIIWIIIILAFVVGFYLAPMMPERMASHWNARGEVDGDMPKFWGLFLMPIVLAIMWLIFWIIPKIDPLKENIEKFRKYFNGFIIAIVLFLTYIYGLSLAWNLEYRFNMTQVLVPAIGVLFYYAGILTQHTERNWFIGIRTPWTLSSDVVWNKTHKIGGKLFKASGIIALFSIVLPQYAIWLIIFPVVFTATYTIVYSYFAYQQEK